MKFKKSSSVQGAWVDKSKLENDTVCKIVSEAREEPSQHTNKDGTPKIQTVAKVEFEGMSESVNVGINRQTKDALIDAFVSLDSEYKVNSLYYYEVLFENNNVKSINVINDD